MKPIFQKVLLRSGYLNKLLENECKTDENEYRTVIKILDGTTIYISEHFNKLKKKGFMLTTDEVTIYGDDIFESTKYLDILTRESNAKIDTLKLNTENHTAVIKFVYPDNLEG